MAPSNSDGSTQVALTRSMYSLMLLMMRTRAASVAERKQGVEPLWTASGSRIRSPSTAHRWKQQSPSARTATTLPMADAAKTNEVEREVEPDKGVVLPAWSLQLDFLS